MCAVSGLAFRVGPVTQLLSSAPYGLVHLGSGGCALIRSE